MKEGVVTSSFGSRTNPVTNKKEVHNGVDIAVPQDTAVFAVQDGKVTAVGEDDFSGVFVRYATVGGHNITYAHLSRVTVKEGDVVRQGQQMAKSGNTGISTGPHLHYTLRTGEQLTDPMKFLALPYTADVKEEYANRGEVIQ